MTKARDLANASTALSAVSATELAFVDGVTSAIQTQMDAKAPSSTAVTLTGTQTLTNKTLTNPVIASVINNTITTTKGDLISATAASTPTRLAVGSNFAFLAADSSTATGLVWDNSAYVAYTPTVAASSGTFTSATVTGSFKRVGKLCFAKFQVNITTNGTAAGQILVTTPFTPASSFANGTWREVQSTGFSGQIFVSTATQFGMANNDNTYPGASTRIFQGSILFEVA